MARRRGWRTGVGATSLNVSILLLGFLALALVSSTAYRVGASMVADVEAPVPPTPDEMLRVQVQNGCGVRGAGAAVASVLRSAPAIDVVQIGNAAGVRLEQTVVVDRVGRRALAERVSEALGGAPIVLQRKPGAPCDVTVIVGYDGGRWDAGGLAEAWGRGS